MKIVEFRIFVPLKWSQCRLATVYSVTRRTREETGDGDGFEMIEQGDFEEDGNPGHYVHRILHFKNKVPSFIRWAIPDKYAHIHEHNRNAFPHTLTTFNIDELKDDLILHTETRHVTYEKGMEFPENLLQLSEEDLAQRKIVYLDILNGPNKDKQFDIHGFSCPEAGISELKGPSGKSSQDQIPEWVSHYDGEITCCVKLVKFHFHWRGLQSAVEKFVTKNVFPGVYIDTHRAMVKWSPEWCKMTLDDVWKMENRIKEELAQQEFDK